MDANGTQQQPGASAGMVRPVGPALGHVVARGMTWMVATSVLAKGASFAAQVVLGWKLSRGDFALFSTAMAIASFVTVCRDMGMRELLVSLGREGYEDLAGAGFWLALVYNAGIAGLIALLAWPVSVRFFGSTELPKLLWVMAMAIPAATPAGILRVKMRLDLRFQTHTLVTTVAALVRQLSMIVFALAGLGALSMALPVLVMAVVDTAMAWWVTRGEGVPPWRRSPQIRQWRSLARRAFWPMVTSVAAISLDWGQFLVLGRVMGADNAVLGVYSFAYNITAQVGLLLSTNGIQVLVPALVLMKHDRERLRQATLRALRLLMLVGSIASVGLAAVMDPLEHLFWRGRWAAATPAVIVLGVFFCWRLTFALTSAVQLAQGQFKRNALLTLAEGVGASLAGWVAVSERGADATAIALWTGAWVLVSRVAVTVWVLVGEGASVRGALLAMFPQWLIALTAGAAGYYSERVMGVGPGVARLLSGRLSESSAGLAADGARAVVAGIVCVVVFVVLCRAILGRQLRDAMVAVPGRIRGLIERMLVLG